MGSEVDDLIRTIADVVPRMLDDLRAAAECPSTDEGWTQACNLITTAPDFDGLVAAVRADPDLAPLAEGAGPFWFHPDGGGARSTVADAAFGFLQTAVQGEALEDESLSEEGLVRRACETVAAARAACRGEPFDVVSLHELRNLNLPEKGARIPTPLGVLLHCPRRALVGIPTISGNSVLMRKRRVRLSYSLEGDPEMPDPNAAYLHEESANLRLLQAAFVLSGLRVPDFGVQMMAWPFVGGRGFSIVSAVPPRNDFWYGQIGLSHADQDRIKEHAELLHAGYERKLDVAYTRIVRSALAPSDDPVSKLVDAVVAWEAMFGAHTETSFRVTASLALLLERDRTNRGALQKRLKTIYGRRSRIIHGGDAPAAVELRVDADDALRVACDALAEVHKFPQEFRRMESAERSTAIILGIAAVDHGTGAPYCRPAESP